MNDTSTANAFANSWNNLPTGSVYTKEQFEDWFLPLNKKDIKGKNVLELGCGNASLLVHLADWNPTSLIGIDLGDSIITANRNMQQTGFPNYKIIKDDLVNYRAEEKADIVYSIGVLHHLKDPFSGFQSVIENTKPGGNFHCWVYAKEGNLIIRLFVDPIRIIASKLPWWLNKYFIATPLAALYFLYAHLIVSLKLSFLPLFEYSKWITKRNFMFFRHVAFDQLVTPQTVYINKTTLENWLKSSDKIDSSSTYVIFRNGNSWKFGGKLY